MNGLLLQLAVTLRLHFRNRMAVIYSYLFPTIFLLAFWVLYRYETPPLVRHMGELLTVTILGGACFGLPTTFVSDRERGVWRRYRLTPVPTSSIVASTVAARYLLLLIAGLIQLALAMLIGMPFPRHPFDLFVAFSCVSFAFIGLGLVIATMADNVPAVQALGQCIFLPMLIIGGVAVPLESLPAWAQHVSAFFPGRYAVEALRACVMGTGLGDARFSVLGLLLIGAAGCVTGARLFRWDSQQRFTAIAGKAWVVVALLAWAAVGIAAETRHRTLVRTTVAATPAPASATPQMPATPQSPPAASAAPPARSQQRRLAHPLALRLLRRNRQRKRQSHGRPSLRRRRRPHERNNQQRSQASRRQRNRRHRPRRRTVRPPHQNRLRPAARNRPVRARHRTGRRPRLKTSTRRLTSAGCRRTRVSSPRSRARTKSRNPRSRSSFRPCTRGYQTGRPEKRRIPSSARATFCMSRPCPTFCRRQSNGSRRSKSMTTCSRRFRSRSSFRRSSGSRSTRWMATTQPLSSCRRWG